MNFPQNTLYSNNSKRFPPIYNYPFVMIRDFFPNNKRTNPYCQGKIKI